MMISIDLVKVQGLRQTDCISKLRDSCAKNQNVQIRVLGYTQINSNRPTYDAVKNSLLEINRATVSHNA